MARTRARIAQLKNLSEEGSKNTTKRSDHESLNDLESKEPYDNGDLERRSNDAEEESGDVEADASEAEPAEPEPQVKSRVQKGRKRKAEEVDEITLEQVRAFNAKRQKVKIGFLQQILDFPREIMYKVCLLV